MPNGHDKNFLRLCGAIEGFRVRYGHWPIRVRVFPGALENVRSLFTGDDLRKLTSKVELVAGEAAFVAEDDAGNAYSYGADGFPARTSEVRAAEWLGVSPRADH